MDINRVELLGRVSNTPHRRTTQKGYEWVTFAIAVNSPMSNGDDSNLKNSTTTTYIQISIFNPLIIKHLDDVGFKQGCTVWVVGRLFVKANREEAITRTYTSIVAEIVEVIKSKKEKPILVNPNEQNKTPF